MVETTEAQSVGSKDTKPHLIQNHGASPDENLLSASSISWARLRGGGSISVKRHKPARPTAGVGATLLDDWASVSRGQECASTVLSPADFFRPFLL